MAPPCPCGLAPVPSHLISHLAPCSATQATFWPFSSLSLWPQGLSTCCAICQRCLYSPLDTRASSSFRSKLFPASYTMYLVTPVISGPLRRVFGGEASRELPLSLSLPRSWLCVPTSQRGDIPTGQWSPGLLLPHLASPHHPWPPLGIAVVLPTLYSPYPAEGSITRTQLPS